MIKMKDCVKSYKTDRDIGRKIETRLKALKKAGVGNTNDARYCLGLSCLCEMKGVKVPA